MKFTFKTLSDPSKFLSQKNKHMRAELVKALPYSCLDGGYLYLARSKTWSSFFDSLLEYEYGLTTVYE
mgnify:CR=1 FL=1